MNTSGRSEGSIFAFHNRGYETFETARKEWRTRTHHDKRKKTLPVTPLKRDTVIRGIVSTNQGYDLPMRMTLADMVNVYQDIWEAHGELLDEKDL